MALSFVLPLFQRIPYDDYTINYFFTRAEFDETGSSAGESIDYTKCDNNDTNKECNQLYDTSITSRNLSAAATAFLSIITVFLLYRVCKRFARFSNYFLCFVLFFMCLVYTLLIASLLKLVLNWPYSKFCAFGGDNTGCEWYLGVSMLIASMSINVVSVMIIISMLVPLCRLFCSCLPCFRSDEAKIAINNRNENVSESEQSEQFDHDNDEKNEIEDISPTPRARMNANNVGNPDRRRRIGCFISVPEWITILVLVGIFTFANTIFCVILVDTWQPASYGAQQYVDNTWDTAQCIDHNGYWSKPVNVTKENNECAFGYPDSEDALKNGTWWTCCSDETCNIAFNYSNLFEDYTSYTSGPECWIDMRALSKASCHPTDEWFTGSDYDISLSPSQRLNYTNSILTTSNTIVLCSLFCNQIWDHCGDLPLTTINTVNMTDMTDSTPMNQVYHSSSDFCINGLAMMIRRETFTDECFAGCGRLSTVTVFIFVVINVTTKVLEM